jgi:hypothetical protein
MKHYSQEHRAAAAALNGRKNNAIKEAIYTQAHEMLQTIVPTAKDENIIHTYGAGEADKI